MPKTLFPNTLFRVFLFIAIALSVAMAVLSTTAKQVHHDEYDHDNAARFYATHWLPPAVGEQAALDAYSIYGTSYLNEWDIVYPLAGKFAKLLDPLIGDFALTLRLFNISLFVILGLIALFSRNAVLGYAIILTSPQLWYVFSYFNGDAFPLFVTFLAVGILSVPDNVVSSEAHRTLRRHLLLGVCIGVLILSKKTFWAFGLFAGGVVVWVEVCHWRRAGDHRRFLRYIGFFLAVIAITAGPRIAYDLYVNGSPAQKQAKVLDVAESLAAPAFKPSTATKKSINLRGKGISPFEMMEPPLHWARFSFFTMFGGYNYNTILASPRFYYVVLSTYGLFLAYLTAMVLLRAASQEKMILVAAIATAVLVVGLAIYASWTADFQPQGRYLFAMFGLVAVVLARNAQWLNQTLMRVFLISGFLLSVHSFAKDGLASTPHFRDLLEISSVFRRPG